MGSTKIYRINKMLENALNIGNRKFPKGIDDTENMTVQFTWYKKGGYSLTHLHPDCEAVYFIGFGEGLEEASARIILGWPLSTGEDVVVNGPTIVEIPTGCAHTIANVGDRDMYLLRIYTPKTRVSVDLMTGQTFSKSADYAKYANEIYAQCPTFDSFLSFADLHKD